MDKKRIPPYAAEIVKIELLEADHVSLKRNS